MATTRLVYLDSFYGANQVGLLDPADGVDGAIGNSGRQALNTLNIAVGPYFASLSGGRVVYAAIGADGRQEPWVTDGTAGGTHRITAIGAGTTSTYYNYAGRNTPTVGGSAAQDFTALDGARALFVADDAVHGPELWVTDGTAAGTALVSDIRPGSMGSGIGRVTALGDGRALFTATDGVNGTALWVTDGTGAGTRLVTNFGWTGRVAYDAGYLSVNPNSIVALGGGRAMVAAVDGDGFGLWTTDGTAAGTRRFLSTGAPLSSSSSDRTISGLTRLGNGLVVFTELSANYLSTLWVTNGTAAGTAEISAQVVSSGFGVLGDGRAVFFTRGTTQAGQQLWVTDGTAAGTVAVKGDAGFILAGNFLSLTQLSDGRVAFYASTSNGSYVWATDGTAAGTVPIGTDARVSSNVLGVLSGAGLVDAPFYYAHYADVAAAGVESAGHYDVSGWHESRDPSAFFSTAGYLNEYRDIKAAGIDPLAHYDSVGWREGRDPSAAFDTNLYLLFNPDVKAAGIDPLAHYLANGQVEGRKMSAVVDSGRIRDLFDPTFYGLSNSDVTASGADLQTHFNAYGVKEGRNPDAYFDVAYYLRQNPDVAASGINPVAHYLNVGWKEGRDPSSHFSTAKYLAAYADVRAAGVNPLAHFLANGILEGRSGFGDRI